VSAVHVPSERQLVVEVTVSNLARSIAFYSSIGFKLIRAEETFAEMGWENSKLLLDERANYEPPSVLAGNVRILVPDVDEHWAKCNRLGIPIYSPIADKYYGLRDFTVLDPDGYGIRFATDIPMPGHP
jgi:catechol 2,3-dioxygenase-like lactoylglutathione lyase family enzyme